MRLATIKKQIHGKYRKFGKIYCKAIDKKIFFNNYGWKHISFDGKGHRRRNKNIIMRLSLVLHAPEVVKNATVALKDQTKEVNINGKIRSVRNVEVASGIRGSRRHITVILRKIGAGQFHYYSVRRTKNKVKRLLLNQKSP